MGARSDECDEGYFRARGSARTGARSRSRARVQVAIRGALQGRAQDVEVASVARG